MVLDRSGVSGLSGCKLTGSGSDWRKDRAETIEQDGPDWGALFVAVGVELVAVVAGFLSAPAQPEATVMMTAVGMFGQGGGWGIPLGHLTLIVTLGGISERPGAGCAVCTAFQGTD